MDYETTCPSGHRLRVTEAHFGQEIKCPTCNASFVVPDLSNQSPPSGLPQVDTSASARRTSMSAGLFEIRGISLVAGRPMLAIGLLLVLVSRGCDSLGERSVKRAEARRTLAEDRFDDSWEAQKKSIQAKIDRIDKKEQKTAADIELKTQLMETKADLNDEEDQAREKEKDGEWRDLDIAKRDAATKNDINAYWREMFFVLGTVVLTLGLLATSVIAEGTERAVCLIMLAIITFSIYVGGVAWIAGGPPM